MGCIVPSGYMNELGIFQRLTTLADATRGRLLRLLERQELTVGELAAALQLPQSTVSRHLKVLSDEGWLASRAEGTSRFYRLSSRLEAEPQRLWQAVRDALVGAEFEQDATRALDLVARRRSRSQEYFSTAATEWDSVRAELFGAEPELRALPALIHPASTVADLGCGTGQLAAMLAPFVRRVIGVDESADMLAGARRRLGQHGNVELLEGRLESVPVEDGSVDIAILSLVLHYVAAPDVALREAARILRSVGRVMIVDMLPHGRDEYREQMGHVWQGFSRAQMEAWFRACGLNPVGWHALPPAPEAKGPLLFVATARKP